MNSEKGECLKKKIKGIILFNVKLVIGKREGAIIIMVTLKEIARECNVSATTVSNILNGKPKVSEETRLRVLDVVKKRGISLIISLRG